MILMILYPAIDLLEGKVVRLREGRRTAVTVYDDDPVRMARRWVEEGATWLHVVDLEGAFEGHPVHTEVLRAIARAVPVPIQAGGGLRDDDAVATTFAAGATRVLVGTRAATEPDWFHRLATRFPGRVAASVDARAGKVTIDGWTEATDLDATSLARRLAAEGAAAILYTDVARDGTLSGPDLEWTARVVGSAGIPVIAAGGVARVEDLPALARIGVAGAILGKALYEGRIDLQAALGAVHCRSCGGPQASPAGGAGEAPAGE